MSKIPKVVAGYLPARYVPPGGTRCGQCRDFIQLSHECKIIDPPEVSDYHGTCIFFILGQPHQAGRPERLLPRRVAGYIEGKDVPTYCGRCVYYKNPEYPMSVCDRVGNTDDDRVDFYGCCNAYEARRDQ